MASLATLRDAYLGAIWEGSTNVIALDVQRAIVKDGCLAPFAGFVAARLENVHERAAKPAADLVRTALADVQQRAAAWPRREDGELEARAVAETLYHVLATALLLEEGQTLRGRRGDFRKLLVATLYARRWLAPATPGAPPFSWRTLAHLERLVDWHPIAAGALAGDPAGHC